MQMFKRLLLIIAIIFLSSGCAQPPPAGELENARSIVAHAYAAGAAQHAPGEYQLANSALRAAELQVKDKEYRRASLTLELARRYSAEALKLTIARKEQLAAEQKQIAEEKQLEEIARQRELQRQVRLKKQQARLELQKKVVVPKPKKPAPVVVKKKPPVVKVPKLVDHVKVKAGENLATLAARAEVYKDALLWPLIYKANRDQIKDPTAIFPGQILLIPRDKSKAEVAAARQEARELHLFQPLN